MENENIVIVKDLTFDYMRDDGEGTIRAVDHVSLEFPRGSFTAI